VFFNSRGSRFGSVGCTWWGVSFGRITLALFILCQASDGLLTYFGVSAFGHAIEGNPILFTWMTIAGTGLTLLIAKVAACACGILLYAHGTHRALASLTALYLVTAVGPWLYLLAAA
jgi:arginine exporter protein ArgO